MAAAAASAATSHTTGPSTSVNSATHNPHDDDTFADAEPPPPYSSIAQDATLEANFSRPYEVQDSGAFVPPAGPPPSLPIRPQQTGQSTHQSYSPPSGPPQRTPSTNHDPRNPQPHIDGVSTFNRPALPLQTPAHNAPLPPRPPQPYSPTVNPTSGQPLLYKGKLLIYPQGFYCPKCHNTGYKAYDPTVPHNRCWEKYGKQYTSILRNSPDFNFQNPTLQKPLPNVRYNAGQNPPHAPGAYHPQYYVAGQQHPPPLSPSPYPQQQQPLSPVSLQAAPQASHYVAPRPGWQGSHMSAPHMMMGRPPPGALVVRPGDPRIGGRLCPECGGRGQIECGFLLLDTETCMTCRGDKGPHQAQDVFSFEK